MGYGRKLNRRAKIIAINRDKYVPLVFKPHTYSSHPVTDKRSITGG